MAAFPVVVIISCLPNQIVNDFIKNPEELQIPIDSKEIDAPQVEEEVDFHDCSDDTGDHFRFREVDQGPFVKPGAEVPHFLPEQEENRETVEEADEQAVEIKPDDEHQRCPSRASDERVDLPIF